MQQDAGLGTSETASRALVHFDPSWHSVSQNEFMVSRSDFVTVLNVTIDVKGREIEALTLG